MTAKRKFMITLAAVGTGAAAGFVAVLFAASQFWIHDIYAGLFAVIALAALWAACAISFVVLSFFKPFRTVLTPWIIVFWLALLGGILYYDMLIC